MSAMYPGLFDALPQSKRRGRAWLRNVAKSERRVFGALGRQAVMYKYGFEVGHAIFHRAGGLARAKHAKRDKRGRFK